jgi:carbon storage regulator
MQILTRLPGDSLHIGDTVVVKVLGYLPDGSVRIGIEAPKDTEIHWGEVYARITEARRAGRPPSPGAIDGTDGISGHTGPNG